MSTTASLGLDLAAKLDVTNCDWLATYLVQRFPDQAEQNPSLPTHLVTQRLRHKQEMREDPRNIVLAHVLTAEQYDIAAELLTSRDRADLLLLWQPPPNVENLVALLRLDESAHLAHYIYRFREDSRYNELYPTDQKLVRRRIPRIQRIRDQYGSERLIPLTKKQRMRHWRAADVVKYSMFDTSSARSALQKVHENLAIHNEDAHQLVTLLGDDENVWDTFLALSDSWDGSLAELAATAKNLA